MLQWKKIGKDDHRLVMDGKLYVLNLRRVEGNIWTAESFAVHDTITADTLELAQVKALASFAAGLTQLAASVIEKYTTSDLYKRATSGELELVG